MSSFVHLRVASGYSLQYGASHPSALVARAADLGLDTLGLTDRDGLYGAIRFAKSCLATGIAPASAWTSPFPSPSRAAAGGVHGHLYVGEPFATRATLGSW